MPISCGVFGWKVEVVGMGVLVRWVFCVDLIGGVCVRVFLGV
jgi:hypothetical protein